MPIENIQQPAIIQINDRLRLRAYQGDYQQAIVWYQDQEVYYNSENITDASKIPDEKYVERMYMYLNRVSELYFIEILENSKYRAIGDVAIKCQNPPIAIGTSEYRGKGIGKLVMLAMIERAKEIGFTQIMGSIVYEHNIVSQKLHESLGFKCVNRIGNELFYDLVL